MISSRRVCYDYNCNIAVRGLRPMVCVRGSCWELGNMIKKNWSILQNELRETVGENNFSNWIAPLQFSKVEDGVAIFEVPNTFWEIMYPRILGICCFIT